MCWFNKFISVVISVALVVCSVLGIVSQKYESKTLFADDGFENGFSVVSMDASQETKLLGDFTYSDNENKPSWMIAQWNSKHCLWDERIESDKYTITDGITKSVTYNPDDKSVSMHLNAQNVYCGAPADVASWPHLLLEQSPIDGYSEMTDREKEFYNCSADKMILNLDIRISDFKDTTNPEGTNAAQFLAYFYVKGTNEQDFVWFGVNLFDSRGPMQTYWSMDTSGSNRMIYTISTEDVYGFKARSLFRNGKPYVSDRWTKVRLDLTPHLDALIEKINEENLFGRHVERSDFYIGGTNIGFEILGNFDCTVDIKNFNITSYIKQRTVASDSSR